MEQATTSLGVSSVPTLGTGRLAAWVVVLALILYLVIAGGGASAGVLYAPYRLLTEAILLVLVTVWLIVAWRVPTWRPASSLWLAIGSILAAFALASVMSWSLRLSVEYLAYAVLSAALYLLLVRLLAYPAFGSRMLALAATLAGTIALLYIARVLMHWISWWETVGHVATPPLRPAFESLMFGNPSAVAAVALLLLSPGVAWLSTRGRGSSIAILVLVGLVATTVVMSGSRGAWLAVTAAAGFMLVLAVVRPDSRGALRDRLRRLPRPALVAIVASVAVIAIVIGPAIARRALAGGGDELRVSLSISAVRMFADDPLTGTGPGTWVVRRAAFTESDEIDFYIPHAHNVPAQTLAEFGLVGVATAGVAIVAIGLLILRGLASTSVLRRRMGWAAVFSVTYLAIHQLVDSYMNMPAILFAGVLPIAFLDSGTQLAEKPIPWTFSGAWRSTGMVSIRVGKPALAIGFIACLLAIGALVRIDSTAIAASEAARLADAGDWARASSLARGAASEDPGLPGYQFLAGIAAARSDPAAALAALRRSATLEDYPQAWLDVAALERSGNDDGAAHAALERAMRLGRAQPAIALPAGTLYLELGDRQAAVSAFADALRVAPGLTDDPFWSRDATTHESWADAVDRAIEIAPSRNAAVIALLAGRIDQARAIVAGLPDADREVLTLAINGWTGDPGARPRLEAIAEGRPLDNRPVIWSALLAGRDGDDAAGERFKRWAAITSGTLGSDIGSDVVVTDTPRIGQQVPGPNANLQGWFVYRRPYPWDLLVPGLPKLTVE